MDTRRANRRLLPVAVLFREHAGGERDDYSAAARGTSPEWVQTKSVPGTRCTPAASKRNPAPDGSTISLCNALQTRAEHATAAPDFGTVPIRRGEPPSLRTSTFPHYKRTIKTNRKCTGYAHNNKFIPAAKDEGKPDLTLPPSFRLHILTPVFDDWAAAALLLQDLDQEVSQVKLKQCVSQEKIKFLSLEFV